MWLHLRKRRRMITTLVMILSLCQTAIGDKLKSSPVTMPIQGICAHRGASTTHPENTLPAFEEAIRIGVQMIEFDVALTRDKKIVLMHDSTIDRTTNGTGKVGDHYLSELKLLDAGSYKGQAFKGTKIPTLSEALSIMPTNIWLNVHLKGSEELARETARIIQQENRTHQCFLACSEKAINAAREAFPEIKHCNMDRQANTPDYVHQTIEMGSEFIQLLGGNHADPKNVKNAKRHQIMVNYCCTNSAEVLRKLIESGVQFPLVDDVHGMMKEAVSIGIPKLKPVYR